MIASRKQVIEQRIAALEAEAVELERFGEDNYAEGTVLIFKTDFGKASGTTYTYAAVKVVGRWFLTGARSMQGVTWDELVDFWRKSETEKIKLVTRTRTILF